MPHHSACRCASMWAAVRTGTRPTNPAASTAARRWRCERQWRECRDLKEVREMRTKNARTLLLMTVLALGAGAARADDLVYAGAGGLWSKISDVSVTATDLSNTAWKAFAGFRPIKQFAVEADYLDLGNQSASFLDGNTNLQYKAFAAYAVGFLPLPVPFLDVFAKGGLARWSSSGGTTVFPSSFTSLSANGTEFA